MSLIIKTDQPRAVEKRWTERTQHGLIEEWTAYDNGDLTCRTIHDINPIIERNKEIQKGDKGFSKTKELRRVASIPLGVYHDFLKQGIDLLDPNNEKELRRLLNDPDYRFLRTSEGVV